MTDFGGARRFRAPDSCNMLQLAPLATVITGVVLLAVGAFLLSYAGIHEIALAAGVSPALAGLYPLIFDALLVVAGVAALALRDARWWLRGYAWFSITILLAVVAVVEPVHAAGISLPRRPTVATVVAMPWVLLLLGFGLWLSMLTHLRTVCAATPLGDPGNRNESVSRAGAWEPVDDQRSAAGTALWQVDHPEAVIPAQPKPDTCDADPGTPEVRLIPAQPKPDTCDSDPGVRLIPKDPEG
jgi:hypothetical protein